MGKGTGKFIKKITYNIRYKNIIIKNLNYKRFQMLKIHIPHNILFKSINKINKTNNLILKTTNTYIIFKNLKVNSFVKKAFFHYSTSKSKIIFRKNKINLIFKTTN